VNVVVKRAFAFGGNGSKKEKTEKKKNKAPREAATNRENLVTVYYGMQTNHTIT